VDGEAIDVETGADEAAPFGSAQQLERKQHEAPGMWFEMGSGGEEILLLRPHVIESAGEPVTGISRTFGDPGVLAGTNLLVFQGNHGRS
jgi:hypothetical protein